MRLLVDEVVKLTRISVGEEFTAHCQACTIRDGFSHAPWEEYKPLVAC
jgi:hypothetical protein